MNGFSLLSEPQNSDYSANEAIDSFDVLYAKYFYKVYRKCLSMTDDTEIAKDLTQDIFIKVLNKIETFQNRSTFSTWLYAVTYNYCLDHIRSSKRTESLSTVTLKETSEPDSSEISNRQKQVLHFFMNELQDIDVAMLQLKYEQGLTIKHISEQYDLSESSVKMRLKRSRDKLRILCSTAIREKEKHFYKPIHA
ncbi:RNA polymerase sigma factor [Spirosoma agri]|uniref:Sigma-70 family RNA polymerase sigma factor n=1 Tax=Spirosoma agri TaxID=1987381 RepID=A0A6M0IQR9_9BACT|nr:sigma-70 family RNA polymerase sigma factor [Spirosoma agri]NEU70659.1 sigma-70 family RNA polymerase sigma factor [Spirosoma agri]